MSAVSAVPVKTLAVVVVALTMAVGRVVPAAIAAQAPSGAAVSASGQCASVSFIGARGSGEEQSASTDGMGPEIFDMYSAANSDLKAGGATVAPKAVSYPAASVDVLKPDATVLALLNQGDSAAALVQYKKTSVDKYDASMTQGIKQAEADVSAVVSSCPGTEIIMAGYSQGAVAVHDAENWLAANRATEFSHIAGTLLLGDPDRVPDTTAKRFGTEPAKGQGLRVYLHLVKAHDVPDPATTAEIANKNDFVADFGLDSLLHHSADFGVHTSYAKNGQALLASAAGWVAAKIMSHTDDGWDIANVSLPADLGGCSGIGVGGCEPTVACATATACAGSASYVDGNGIAHALLLWGAGISWQKRPGPVPADGDVSQPALLHGVSCTATAVCAATGLYTTTGNAGATMVLSGHAAGWTAVTAPATAFGSGVGTPPACGSNGCMAAGPNLLEWLTGSSWTPLQAPVPAGNPANTEEVLYSAACAGATTCASSGLYGPATSQEVMVSGHGSSWTASRIALPAGAEAASPQGPENVACEPSGHCVAVLPYANVLAQSQALVVWGYGSSWSVVPNLPVPAGGIAGSAIPFSAACAPSDCLLAGFYTQKSGAVRGLLLWGSGSTWQASQEPLPAGAMALEGGSDLSCSSAKLCVAAGNYVNAAGNRQGMLVWGSGSSWHVAAAPSAILMYGVGCAPNAQCAAVGSDTGADLKLFWGPA